MAEEDEDESVDQNCTEHADEDPEVVQPETLVLIFMADPAPCAGSNVEILAMHERAKSSHQIYESPESGNDAVEY